MAGSTRQSRELKKLLAALRAQKRLEQQFDYIDFVEDILIPAQEQLLSGEARLQIEKTSKDAARSVIKVPIPKKAKHGTGTRSKS